MEAIVVCLLLLAAGEAQSHPSLDTAANEYFVGFFKNYHGIGDITLFITTAESVPVPFTISSSTGQIYSGAATNSVAINVTLPSTFAVLNDTVRDGGVWVYATDASKELTVHGVNDNIQGSTDGFVALPCHDYQKQNYTYYAVSTHFGRTINSEINAEGIASEVLLIGCENDTELTITPTQTIEIPSDLVRGGNSSVPVSSGESYTVSLDRLQTFLLSNTLDLTGSKVVSNKPIAFFSGHECADVPLGVVACDHLVEQLPPTLTWGRRFFVVSLLGKTAGEQYKLITSAATTTVVCYCYTPGGSVSETFITTLNGAGRSHEFHIGQNMFCSLQASNPVLLVQFAIGAGREPSYYGDPFMMMIPPVEQYSNNYTFVTQSGFQNAVTVTVASEIFNSEDIVLNGNSLDSANWTEIYCSTQTVCGYGTQVSVSVGRNFIRHRAPTARLGTFVYGFRQSTGYGYPAGMQLNPISADCGPPVAPQNGFLESYTSTINGSEVFYSCNPGHVPEGRKSSVCTENGWIPNPADFSCTVVNCGPPVAPWNGFLSSYTTTINGSEVFYSCDPGLVPEGRMRAVCTRNGWSPNPADLRCTVATTTRVKATVYHHTITTTATTATTATTTAIVRKPLDSRAQPVATEHAVPSSTQFSTLSFVIGLAGGGISMIIITSLILIVMCVIMKRRQTRNITISTSAAQREKMGIKMTEDAVYEVPFSMIEMKECEAYAPLPNGP